MLNSLMKSHPKLKATGLAVAALALGAGVAATGVRSQALAAGDEFSAPQKLAIEAIIKDYLLKNPEVLMEVQQALESRMDEIREKQLSKALPDNAEFLFRRANAPAVNVDGDVTVVEFFDYNCGYCKRAFGEVAKLIEKDKNIRVVFAELPIIRDESEPVSRLALAAQRRLPVTGPSGMVGEVGQALTDIDPEHGGSVATHGEMWQAIAAESIPQGSRVRVTRVDVLRLVVRSE